MDTYMKLNLRRLLSHVPVISSNCLIALLETRSTKNVSPPPLSRPILLSPGLLAIFLSYSRSTGTLFVSFSVRPIQHDYPSGASDRG